jgi:hypothetical protein
LATTKSFTNGPASSAARASCRSGSARYIAAAPGIGSRSRTRRRRRCAVRLGKNDVRSGKGRHAMALNRVFWRWSQPDVRQKVLEIVSYTMATPRQAAAALSELCVGMGPCNPTAAHCSRKCSLLACDGSDRLKFQP